MMQLWKKWLRRELKFSVRDTLLSLGILIVVTVISLALQVFDESRNYVSMLFVLGVFLIARSTEGYFYGIAASLLSVLIVNFVFTYPYFVFNFGLSGYPIAMLSMLVVSITTSALTSKAKRSAQTKLEAEREKTRSNLLRAISHDLRTPLTSILGTSSALLESGDQLPPETRRSLLRDMRDDAQWLIRMVENLLTITRIDGDGETKVAKTPEAGEEVLEAAVAKFRKQNPSWRVKIQIPDEFLMIPMDAILVEQVLLNLMENAVHHGVGADEIQVSLFRRGTDGVFRVQDNGCGIDPEILPRIFSVTAAGAVREGDSKRNMGIGLSVCNTIICAHGGAMEAENAPEGGAVFQFCLPLEEESYE